jgi:DNA polymerase III epsilon subunit-like protein
MDTSARREAIRKARAYLEQKPVYLDTETTGIGPQAEVIEIGILDDDDQPLFSSLVRPRGAIDPAAARVHGITPEMLAEAPGWADIWPAAQAVLEGRRVGVYNAEFDLRLMKQSHSRSWLRWTLPERNFFDIMDLYARFYGAWDPRRNSYRWQSLELAGQQCGIALPNAHRAIDDCRLTRALLHYIASAGQPASLP